MVSPLHLRTIAYKNVKYHFRSYVAYFFSCTFAVWLYFQYLSLLLHPILQEDVVPDQFVMLMFLVQWMIVLFSFLFIGYSQSAFLRDRKKDIGLFQVLGMEVRHITHLLFWENMIVGSASILLGIGLGFVTSKLFFMIVSRILALPEMIPFHFSMSAVFITILVFFFLFGSISLWNRFFIRKVSIAELFRQAVKPKKAQPFSIGWILIALASLLSAYVLMWGGSEVNQLGWRIPLIFPLILIGTYFAFTQISVAVIEKLTQSKSFFYRGKNLFILSQLRFRMTDNARILFMVAILSSAVFTSVGVSFTYYVDAERLAMEQAPYHLNVIGEPGGLSTEEVKKQIKQHNLSIKGEWHLTFLDLSDHSIKGLPSQTYLTSVRTYNQLVLISGKMDPIRLEKDEALFSRSSGVWKRGVQSIPTHRVTVGDQTVRIEREFLGILFNESVVTTNLLVVSDSVYQKVAQRFPDQQLVVHAYRFSDWKSSQPLLTELIQHIEQKEKRKVYPYETLHGTAITYQLLKDIFAPFMFVSLLIGILFFLASGSILYFRLFMEASYDRREMKIFHQLGISPSEAKGILGWQVWLLFYLPFLVGWIHSAFALRFFSQLFEQPIWSTFMIISVGYLLVYSCYYAWTKRTYVQTVIGDLHKY